MKKVLALVFVIVVTIALYFSPVKIMVLNWKYPSYIDLIQKGYTSNEIKDFHESLSDEEYLLLVSSDYASDIKKQVSNEKYRVLKEKRYTESEADEILSLSDELIQFYLTHDNLNHQYDLIHHDYFVLDRYDRYNAYSISNPNLDSETVLRTVNTDRDYELYTHIQMADTSKPNEILVNKYYQLPSNYVPDLYESYLGFMMEKWAAFALSEMCSKMTSLGFDFSISNTYRAYTKQERIYNSYLQTQSQTIVDTYSARPGHSEHQAGLAVDFKSTSEDIVYFANTDAYKWLKENAHIYGFIQRYTEENSIYTGYMAEEWHFRYVGLDLAQIVYETKLTLEEVLVLYRK